MAKARAGTTGKTAGSAMLRIRRVWIGAKKYTSSLGEEKEICDDA
jgi:hypothetical protein